MYMLESTDVGNVTIRISTVRRPGCNEYKRVEVLYGFEACNSLTLTTTTKAKINVEYDNGEEVQDKNTGNIDEGGDGDYGWESGEEDWDC